MNEVPPPLETPRLVLERLADEHADALFPGVSDEHLYTFAPDRPPESPAHLRAWIRSVKAGPPPAQQERWLDWVVRLRDAPILVGLLEATIWPDGRADLGYLVFRRFWRHGYATEACRRALAHLLAEQGVRVVSAEMDARNVPSVIVAERLGFSLTQRTPSDGGERLRYELHGTPARPREDLSRRGTTRPVCTPREASRS